MDWEEKIAELSPLQAQFVQQLAIMREMRRSSILPGYHYAGQEDFLLQHGEWFEPIPWAHDDMKGIPKNCFNHSATLCLTHSNLAYVEGLAAYSANLLLPIEHAWVTTSHGDLIDGTWSNTGVVYLGVRFPVNMIIHALHHGGTVFQSPHNRFAIYKNPWHPQ